MNRSFRCSLLLSLVLLLPGKAAVVYMSLAGQQDNFLRAGYPDKLFDFNGDGSSELIFTATGLGTSTVTVDPQTNTDVRIYYERGAAVLGVGSIIDVNATLYAGTKLVEHSWGSGGSPQLMSYFNSGGTGGPWNGRTGYLGFLFLDSLSTAHFGWLRITDNGGSLEFHEWAYETADAKPIYAGQVPETSVLFTSLASLAFLHLRRRR